MVYLSLLCHKSSVGRTINTVDTTQELGWQSWLNLDEGTPRPHIEEVKKRQINRRFIYVAPNISGTSPLPDCAEGYRPESKTGQCIKVAQLNHTSQMDFLLQGLNAKYATPVIRGGYENHPASDSSSTGLPQMPIPFDISPEPEEMTKESVDVADEMTSADERAGKEETTETVTKTTEPSAGNAAFTLSNRNRDQLKILLLLVVLILT
jgi:hypothetical protein